MDALQRKKAQRFLVLKEAYRLSDGNPEVGFNQAEIERALGFSTEQVDALVRYLADEGLLAYHSFGRNLEITHDGVREYEAAVEEPAVPTHYFPPVNIIQIERMENSAIQQGSVASTQLQTTTVFDRAALAALVLQLRSTSLDLSDVDRQTFESDVSTLEAHIKRPELKHSIIRETLQSIRSVVEGAGGGLLAAKIAEILGMVVV